jgi:hypothetical protein
MSESEILSNFEKFKKLLLRVESRKEQLSAFLEKYGERIATSPGHDRNNRHAACPGGLIKRNLQTFSNARELSKMTAFADKEIDLDSVIITTLLHDIGRMGDDTGDYYVAQTSSWHLEKGNYYTYNPNIMRMTHPHRGLYLLQAEGIPLTQDEWIAIMSQPTQHDDAKFYVGFESPLASLLHTSIRMTNMLDFCGPENN